MSGSKFIDEIDRLFEQMVRGPWSRPRRAAPAGSPRLPSGHTHLDVDLPIDGGLIGDVAVALEGRRLIVRARRRAGTGRQEQTIERVFTMPEDAEVTGIEARFEGDVLHVRVSLAPQRG